ncbi:hypothetical protein B0H16DRAFT_1737125 [Mycena metata]|uniref:Uncharacterized protein n=1 Tax=Mycena metata TaxID=1033252 RepID=A0AAD7MM10_9AGAR|nr:hypothetical protein B0H16DRAFT_1737125 [Mycena metata]
MPFRLGSRRFLESLHFARGRTIHDSEDCRVMLDVDPQHALLRFRRRIYPSFLLRLILQKNHLPTPSYYQTSTPPTPRPKCTAGSPPARPSRAACCAPAAVRRGNPNEGVPGVPGGEGGGSGCGRSDVREGGGWDEHGASVRPLRSEAECVMVRTVPVVPHVCYRVAVSFPACLSLLIFQYLHLGVTPTSPPWTPASTRTRAHSPISLAAAATAPHRAPIPHFSYSVTPLYADTRVAMPLNWVCDHLPQEGRPPPVGLSWAQHTDARVQWRGSNPPRGSRRRPGEQERYSVLDPAGAGDDTLGLELAGLFTTRDSQPMPVLDDVGVDTRMTAESRRRSSPLSPPGNVPRARLPCALLDVAFAGAALNREPSQCRDLGKMLQWRRAHDLQTASRRGSTRCPSSSTSSRSYVDTTGARGAHRRRETRVEPEEDLGAYHSRMSDYAGKGAKLTDLQPLPRVCAGDEHGSRYDVVGDMGKRAEGRGARASIDGWEMKSAEAEDED